MDLTHKTIPDDIRQAADKVATWMAMNGHERWALGGICDRSHADRAGALTKAIQGFMRVCQKPQCSHCHHPFGFTHSFDSKCPVEARWSARFQEVCSALIHS